MAILFSVYSLDIKTYFYGFSLVEPRFFLPVRVLGSYTVGGYNNDTLRKSNFARRAVIDRCINNEPFIYGYAAIFRRRCRKDHRLQPFGVDTLIDLLPMCEMATASSFEKAREMLDSQKFDLVILDIMGVDGYGLLEMATRKNIPAVMLTAHAWSPDNLVRSIKEGAVSYLPKEELANITDYLNDVLSAKKEGRDPWASWHERLPASYFERRWGAAWKDNDRQFWETFKAGLKAKRSASKKED